MYKSFIKFLLSLLVTGFMMGSAIAAGLPTGYPKVEEFNSVGTIDSAVYDNKIVIGDEEYLIAKSIIVVVPGKKGSTLDDLKQGRIAGLFATAGTTDKKPVVTEIWMFPRSYK